MNSPLILWRCDSRNWRFTQNTFKICLVSVKTVQAWEAGERSPNHAALRLLELIDQGIYVPKGVKHRRQSQSKRRQAAHMR
jgi:hypothetical protein